MLITTSMWGIKRKLKRKKTLEYLRNLRQIRDFILSCEHGEEQSAANILKRYFHYTNHSISYGGQFLTCWANAITEHDKFYGFGTSELEALKELGLSIYKTKINNYLSNN